MKSNSVAFAFVVVVASFIGGGCASRDFGTTIRDPYTGKVIGHEEYKESGLGSEWGRRDVRADTSGVLTSSFNGSWSESFAAPGHGRRQPTWEGRFGRMATPSEMAEIEMKGETFIATSQEGEAAAMEVLHPPKDPRVDQLVELVKLNQQQLKRLEAERPPAVGQKR